MNLTRKKTLAKQLPDLKQILHSTIFKKLTDKARALMANPSKVLSTLEEVLKKSGALKAGGPVISLVQDVPTLVRFLTAAILRQYTAAPKKTLLRVLAALLYFIFITDLIPDFIPAIGLLDDATIIAWVVASVHKDLDDFRKWEASRI